MSGSKIQEHCPCRLHRLLAQYEPGASSIDLLASKATVSVTAPVPDVRAEPGKPVKLEIEVLPGSAKCIRRRCRLLRRT